MTPQNTPAWYCFGKGCQCQLHNFFAKFSAELYCGTGFESWDLNLHILYIISLNNIVVSVQLEQKVFPSSSCVTLSQVVFTMDEVDFVQNLVYYVERAYRIPDYGMWERGSRDNIGKRELHARLANDMTAA